MLADLPQGGPAGAAAVPYDDDDEDAEAAAAEGDPPPPPLDGGGDEDDPDSCAACLPQRLNPLPATIAGNGHGSLILSSPLHPSSPPCRRAYALKAYEKMLDGLPLAESLRLKGYNTERGRPDKLAALAERLGARIVWICGPLTKKKDSDNLQAFHNQSAQGVCGTPGCRELTVPKAVRYLLHVTAADRFRCDRCPSGWTTGWNFSADGRAQLGFVEGGKCEYTPDALEAALQDRLAEVAERLGVEISELQQEGDVGMQANGQDVDISRTAVSVPCCTPGCAARVSNQIKAWLRCQAGAPVRCGYHAFVSAS